MNIIYIGKFCYTTMITSQNSIRNVSVATDEGPSPKLALSKGGSRGNMESYLRKLFKLDHCNRLAMT